MCLHRCTKDQGALQKLLEPCNIRCNSILDPFLVVSSVLYAPALFIVRITCGFKYLQEMEL